MYHVFIRAAHLQPPVASTCGTPPKDLPTRWVMVKQWPFDTAGARTIHSQIVKLHDGRSINLDMLQLNKRLLDLKTERATKSDDDPDFWEHFMRCLKLPQIHDECFRAVKTALDSRWFTLTNRHFPTVTPPCTPTKEDNYSCSKPPNGDGGVCILVYKEPSEQVSRCTYFVS